MFSSFRRGCGAASMLVLLAPLTAQAGMTIPKFSEIAKARLEVLSFFLVLYLLLALVYQWAWNSLGKDFLKLPRIRYGRALAMLAVCGLFIYVVLTMISGARELMTPGAWARSGVGYKLREPEKDPKVWLDMARRSSLERLRTFLWQYAERHGGAFPGSRDQPDIPAAEWKSIDPEGQPLIYLPGAKPNTGQEILAYEPSSFGVTRLVLLSDGTIVPMKETEITERVEKRIAELNASAPKETGK